MDMESSLAKLSEFVPAEVIYDTSAEIEWLEKRHGRITASNFDKLMKSGRSGEKFGETAWSYMRLVAAERLGSYYSFDSSSTQFGRDNESRAIEAYADRFPKAQIDATPFNFIEWLNDAGGSPDALVDHDRVLEVKCPANPNNHVATLSRGYIDPRYEWQCLGHLLVTGRRFLDFVSFDPRMDAPWRLAVVTIDRDQFRTRLRNLDKRIALANEQIWNIVNAIKRKYDQ